MTDFKEKQSQILDKIRNTCYNVHITMTEGKTKKNHRTVHSQKAIEPNI